MLPSRNLRSNRRPALAAWGMAVALVALVVVTFWPVIDNGFVDWDDDANFLTNSSFRGLGWDNIRWAWTTFHLGLYQPLGWMLLEGEFVLWGLDPDALVGLGMESLVRRVTHA